MPIPLSINLFERGANGVPGGGFVASLQGRTTAYQHTITDRHGFESMSVSLVVRMSEALDWLQPARLMRGVVVSGPHGSICWEGFLHTIRAQIGQKPQSLSLDPVGNRVRCKYTTVLDTPGTTASASNTTSQALFGVKDYIATLNKDTATAAANKRDRVLGMIALPRSNEPSEAATGDQGEITLELSFVGWYATLGWVVTSRTSTTTTSSTAQVATLIGTASPGIGATNPFFSTDITDIVSGGPAATEYIEPETTYQAKIETLLQGGDGAGGAYTWGVYEGRRFRVAARQTAVSYYEIAGDGNLYSVNGQRVAPWDARPNTVSVIRNMHDLAPTSGSVDTSNQKYIGRVSCSIAADHMGVSLEPSETDGIGPMLAAFKQVR